LKIKIRRKTDTKSKSFEVDTSESEADDEENKPEEKNTPEKSAEPVRASLKMKFFFKKTEKETEKNTPTRTKSKKKKHKRKRTSTNESKSNDRIKQEELDQSGPVDSSFNEDIVFDEDTPAAATEEVSMKKEELSESKEENPMLGEDEEDSISKADDSLEVEDGEMVEEEIVGVDDGEVVSWDEVVAEEVVADEVAPSPSPDLEPELTTEQSLALKVNHARAMAKSVKASHFKKKKKTLSKKAKAKAEEKQKRKVSGYNLWSSKMRKQVATQFPGLQFGDVSKKLSDLWKRIPEKEKQMWKFRSVKMANQLERLHSTTTKRKFGSKMIETGPKKKSVLQKALTQIDTTQQTFPPHKNPEQTMKRELAKLPAPAVEPIDAAAHFHLLGESLLTIGKKVRSSGGVASTSGALSLLLDSMVCSLAPLLTLVNQIPELNGALPDELMSDTLANIAYYMPGM
uniref:HMG box domain-containing protein n=1 Tax=Ciona savignyi TaxID=51511 RepID=H2YZ37_CIOSA